MISENSKRINPEGGGQGNKVLPSSSNTYNKGDLSVTE